MVVGISMKAQCSDTHEAGFGEKEKKKNPYRAM